MSEHREIILGVDLGGTKIAVALATAQRKILSRRCSLTLTPTSPDVMIDTISTTIEKNISAGKLKSQLLGSGALE